MILDTAWLVAAIAAAAALALTVCAAALMVRSRRLARRLGSLERDLAACRAEVAATAGIGARVGERLRRLDQISTQLSDRLGQLELRGDGRPYDHAIAFVQHGADANRLVAHFGLSRGEADLVTLVHSRRKAS
jgi:hypothetical protein